MPHLKFHSGCQPKFWFDVVTVYSGDWDKGPEVSPPKGGGLDPSSSLAGHVILLPGLITLKTRLVGSSTRAHTAKAWNCSPPKQAPSSFCSSSPALPEAGMEFAPRLLRQGDSRAVLHLAPSWSWTSSASAAARPRVESSPSGHPDFPPCVGQCGSNPALRGGEGWAARPLYLIMYSFIVSYAN